MPCDARRRRGDASALPTRGVLDRSRGAPGEATACLCQAPSAAASQAAPDRAGSARHCEPRCRRWDQRRGGRVGGMLLLGRVLNEFIFSPQTFIYIRKNCTPEAFRTRTSVQQSTVEPTRSHDQTPPLVTDSRPFADETPSSPGDEGNLTPRGRRTTGIVRGNPLPDRATRLI